MSPKLRKVATLIGLVLLALPGLDQLVGFTRIVVSRLRYPMDLEWMEGGCLYMAHRLASGLPIYTSPDRGYIPFPYAPLHSALLALFGKIVGLDYWSGRFLSVAALAIGMAAVTRATWREWRDTPLEYPVAALALGWVLAGYPLAGNCYDLIRVDALACAITIVAAAWVARGPLRRFDVALVAVLLTASVFTKQTMAPFAAWICLLAIFRDRWRGVVLSLATGVLSLATLAGLQLATSGNFWFYTVKMLSKHPVDAARVVEGAATLAAFAPYALLVPVGLGYLAWRRVLTAEVLLWGGLQICAFVTSVVALGKATAWLNNLMYAIMFAGPVTLLVGGALVRALPTEKAKNIAKIAIPSVLALLLVRAHYDPTPFIVDEAQRSRAYALNAAIAKLDGPVLYPTSPYLPIRNGRGPSSAFHPMSYFDAFGAGVPTPGLYDYLRASDAKYMVLSECLTGPEYELIVGHDLDRLFAFDAHLPDEARGIHMRTGFDCAAVDVYRRRDDPSPQPRTRPEAPAPAGAVAEPLKADAIAVGGGYPESGHACALREGQVWCWGANSWGQVSPSLPFGSVHRPRRVFEGALAVTAGAMHTCALTATGAQCWGDNRQGELGDGTTTRRDAPVRVATDRELVHLVAGGHHTCAIDEEQKVLCWGDHASAWSPPVARGVVELAAGVDHTCARDDAGAVTCWGLVPGVGLFREPRVVPLPSAARAIAAAADETCAVLDDGRLVCWGLGGHADLGPASAWRPSHEPVTITGLGNVSSVALGRHHACAASGAMVSCWGANQSGESSAMETWQDVVEPKRFVELEGAKALALGLEFGCAIGKDDVVTCWGKDDRGQLGNDAWALFGGRPPAAVRWFKAE
jgi:alpha-tubulin suppressor-like RCC1 family protein